MNGEVQLIVNSEVPTEIASISNNPIYVGIGSLSRLIVTSSNEVAALVSGDSLTTVSYTHLTLPTNREV